MKQNSCLLILFFSVWAGPSWATTYYVATTGNNANPGTIGSPWLTVQKAANTAVAGDTVYIRGGTYFEYVTFSNSGNSSNRITFQNYPNETPIIDGQLRKPTSSPWADPEVFKVIGSFLVFRGLEVAHCQAGCIGTYGTDNTYDTLHVHDGTGVGIWNFQTFRTTVINSKVHDFYDFYQGGENADCMAVSSSASNAPTYGYHTFDGNELYNCSDDGLDMWSSSHNIVKNNKIHHTGLRSDGYGAAGHKNPFVSFWGFSPNTTNGDGNGIKIGSEVYAGSGNGTTLTNNIVWNVMANGYDTDGGSGEILYNNTGWQNGDCNYAQYTLSNTFRNNLSYQAINCVSGGANMSPPFVADHNSWDIGSPNPNFVSTDPSSPNFLKLSAGSPVIDVGVDVGLSFSGSAPDLGAYEYAGSGDPTSPIPPVGLKVF